MLLGNTEMEIENRSLASKRAIILDGE